MNNVARLFWIAVLCLNMHAQSVSPAFFNGLQWRSLGPFRAGRSVAATGVPGGGATFYFGSVDGGVWKTTDAGTVWTPVFDEQPVASIGALEAAPSNPQVLYAGTGESDIRSNLASGDGIYKSTDGGHTWKNVGLKDTRQISRVVVDTNNPDRVFVAALGHAYGPNEERGIFRSSNGGETWQKVLYKGPSVGAADLAIAADNPQVLLAAMWEAHRPPWSTYAPIIGTGSGLWLSSDGGDKWRELSGHGLPSGKWGRAAVAIARGTSGRRFYAAIEADRSGLYRSDDGGENWMNVNADSRVTSRAWYFSSITVDPNDPDIVYVPNVALYKLSDGGKTLSIVRGAPGGDDYHQLWIDPGNSQHMVLATDQGTTVTLNGGVTWSSWYNQPTGQFYHVVADNEFPYHIYGAQQDSGTAATVIRTDHGQIDARDWSTVGGSESGYIAPDPKDSHIFYVSGTFGSLARYDSRTMQSQNIAPFPLPGGVGGEISTRKYRDPWTPVVVFSPADPSALYFGTQYVMRTVDGGLHWQTISPDLTGAVQNKNSDSKPEGPATVENAKERGYGVVYTIAPSPLSAATIWAGSDTGLIHLTRDGGRTWKDVTPPEISPWSKITQLEASHFRAGEAFAAVDRHRLDDRRPYLYRTEDWGRTWTALAQGIPDGAFLNVVREDPKRQNLLFAGTEFGVYVSFDNGNGWMPLQLNLPVTSIRDLAIHGDDLIAATHGRSFWVLDDITALRQIDKQSATVSPLLYKPGRAIRITNDNFLGTPQPPEEPQAQNPPHGAVLDYYLPEHVDGEVSLEIFDSAGKSVRRFTSREKVPPLPKDIAIAPRWLKEAQILSEQPGMHRFVWDLRYGRTGERTTGDPDDEGVDHWIGPLAMPGMYKVVLSVSGKRFAQPLQVLVDPRSKATAAELTAQFNWSQKAFEDMIIAQRATEEVTALRRQVDKAKTQMASSSEGVPALLTTADDKTKQILRGGPKGPEHGLTSLSRTFALILASLAGADRMPPSQLVDVYLSSSKDLKSLSVEWETFKKISLPGLNGQLRQVGLAPIEFSRQR